jgi:hypothetical protein
MRRYYWVAQCAGRKDKAPTELIATTLSAVDLLTKMVLALFLSQLRDAFEPNCKWLEALSTTAKKQTPDLSKS